MQVGQPQKNPFQQARHALARIVEAFSEIAASGHQVAQEQEHRRVVHSAHAQEGGQLREAKASVKGENPS